ncbi:hypothetical protein C9374_006474 [Naegleria lovaniensis]|uniref:F-box domain-containing protein n=1 Tax=Naegleria lovaniensis TaxID=51637 RepID=A0AA88KJF1_NAELO|nr:uncharacterized protein C9374_006474 [Naegleria lovaniensis]KAG2381485.1 hypothetical protein C9374_006474 [Naegleria lovaniensis]
MGQPKSIMNNSISFPLEMNVEISSATPGLITDLLVIIFEFLDASSVRQSCMLVSKQWFYTARSSHSKLTAWLHWEGKFKNYQCTMNIDHYDQLRTLLNNQCLMLKILNLSNNCLYDRGAKMLCECSRLKYLSELYICKNQLTWQAVQDLANSKYMKNLTRLDVSDNSIELSGVKAIVSSSYLTNITDLGLGNCNITAEGAVLIANNSNAHKLTRLLLGYNDIGAQGVQSIVESVTTGKLCHLKSLDIGHNDLDNDVALYIAANKTFITQVCYLEAYSNRFKQDGIRTLEQCYESKDGKEYLNLELDVRKLSLALEGVMAFK